MNWWIFGGVVVGVVVLGILMQRFGLIDVVGSSAAKSAGNGAGLIGIGDEIFAPARHEAAMELGRQTILPAPAPVAGDPLTGDPVAGDPVTGDRLAGDPQAGDPRAGARQQDAPPRGVYDGRVTIDLRRTG